MNLLKVATAHVLGQVSSLLPGSGATDGLPPGAVRSGSSWAANPLAAAFAALGVGNDEDALAPPYPAEWPCATSKKFHGFPCAHFNPASGRWEYLYPGAPVPAPLSPPGDGAPVLTVATYNIDFDTDVRFAERMRHIFLEVLPSTRADVICLQEVVLNTTVIDILRTAPWLQAGGGWYVSAIDRAAPVRGYDVLLLSRFPVAQLGWVPLPTFMGRRALVADVHVPVPRAATEEGGDVDVAVVRVVTVHLESLNNSGLRAKQLRRVRGLGRRNALGLQPATTTAPTTVAPTASSSDTEGDPSASAAPTPAPVPAPQPFDDTASIASSASGSDFAAAFLDDAEVDAVILAGDHNFTERFEDAHPVLAAARFIDAWRVAHDRAPHPSLAENPIGATWGVNYDPGRFPPARFDRVYVQQGKRRFRPIAVRHVAGGAVPEAVEKGWMHPRENVPVCASDHVCVVVELALGEGDGDVSDDGEETDRDLDVDVDIAGTPGHGTEAGTEPASPTRAQMLAVVEPQVATLVEAVDALVATDALDGADTSDSPSNARQAHADEPPAAAGTTPAGPHMP
ncbi:hypothetical protein GGF32_003414 [Allomyces javanicus]|nr:hypothetical protein GGF32_003414 [Allomyces javanicus]